MGPGELSNRSVSEILTIFAPTSHFYSVSIAGAGSGDWDRLNVLYNLEAGN